MSVQPHHARMEQGVILRLPGLYLTPARVYVYVGLFRASARRLRNAKLGSRGVRDLRGTRRRQVATQSIQ